MAIAPDLPEIPPGLEAECSDPGVGPVASVSDAVTVLGDNRVYAACNKRKHRDVKAFYRDVKARFSG